MSPRRTKDLAFRLAAITGLTGLLLLSASLLEGAGREKPILENHCYGGAPLLAVDEASDELVVRKRYALSFDRLRRVPRWTAFRVSRENLDTPPRKGRYATFRSDLGLRTSDYTGSFYHRGHMAPYGVAGGAGDEAVLEINHMANIAPQSPAFNAGGGLWWTLERLVQDTFVRDRGETVYLLAGGIFGPLEFDAVEAEGRPPIGVPVLYWQVLVVPRDDGPLVCAFLFPHVRQPHEGAELDDYLVSIDHVEALAGLDLLPELDVDETDEGTAAWAELLGEAE